MPSFDLSLSTRSPLLSDGEPGDFISEHRGTVLAIDDAGAETAVGYVRALKLHAGLAWEKGESLFDVCDSHSHEMHAIHSLLYKPGGYTLRETLARRFEAGECDLSALGIQPRSRFCSARISTHSFASQRPARIIAVARRISRKVPIRSRLPARIRAASGRCPL